MLIQKLQLSAEAGVNTRENKKEETRGNSQLHANNYTRPRQYGNSRDIEGKPKCYNCGKFGYMARACKAKYFDCRSNDRLFEQRKEQL